MWPEIPAELAELTEEELGRLLDECVRFANEVAPTISSAEDVSNLNDLVSGVERLRSEQSTREEAALAIQEQVNSALALVNRAGDEEEDEGDAEEETAEGEGENEGEGGELPEAEPGSGPANPTPAPNPETGEAPAPTAEDVRKAAGKKPISLSEMTKRTPAYTRPRPVEPVGRCSITASADVPGFRPGQPLRSTRDIAQALIERHHNLSGGSGGIEDRVPVARFSLDYPADRKFSSLDSVQTNMGRVKEWLSKGTSPAALTAAGGLCAPTEGYYDQLVIADAVRPVRDFLPNMGADRGGIRFNPPPKLTQVTSGVGLLTAAGDAAGNVTVADGATTNGSPTVTSATAAFTSADVGRTISGAGIPAGSTIIAVGSATSVTISQNATATATGVSITIGRATKPTFHVSCPSIVEVVVAAVFNSIEFGNYLGRSFPEQVEAWVTLAAAIQARTAETFLLDQIAANSTAVTSAGLVGAGREVLARIGQAAAGYRSRNRMAADAPLDVMAPAWTLDLMVADFSRTFTDDPDLLGLARTEAESWLAGRGVRIGWYVDSKTGGNQIIGSQSAGVLNQFPSTLYAYVFAPGTFLHLDGGTLDLGLVRDSTLNASNNFRMFTESFENVAFVGVESLEVALAVCPDGSYGAAKTVTCPIVT
jgi:hypothetical protein